MLACDFLQKKETTIEILEGIDKEILRIEKFRKSTQDLRSKVYYDRYITANF